MRYFIYLAYDGKNYHGWQIQPNGNSIQAELSEAVSLFVKKETEVIGAGRTDAEVNASLMVAHFDIESPILSDNGQDFETWLAHKLNRKLPADISVYRVVRVNDEAHARFSATARTYQYHITTVKSPFNRYYTYRFPQPLDFALMNQAAKHLFDYTDFTSFSKLHTDAKTNDCTIMKAEWKQSETDSNEWIFTITANRFLRNMVRAVVGTLLEVGRGAMTIEQFCQTIEKKDRCAAGTSVPGNALFLTDIQYPDECFVVNE